MQAVGAGRASSPAEEAGGRLQALLEEQGGALLCPLRFPSAWQFCTWQLWLLGGTCMGQLSAQALDKVNKTP